MVVLDSYLKKNFKLQVFSNPNFETSCHLFSEEVHFISTNQEQFSFKTSNGFLLKKNKEATIYIHDTKEAHVQRVHLFFNEDEINLHLFEPFKNIKNYFVYAGDTLLHQWKNSIFSYDKIVDEVRKIGLRQKLMNFFSFLEIFF